MKKLIIPSLFIIGLTSIIISCQKPTSPTNPLETIKIGALLPLTGDIATYGQQEKMGIELALDQINQGAGINGQYIKVYFEDNKSDPKNALTAYQKLSQIEKINIFLTVGSSLTLAISPQIEQDKNLLFAVAAHSDVTKNPYTFRGIPTSQDYIQNLQTLIEQKNLNKISLLYLNNDFGTSIKNTFVDKYSSRIIAQEAYASDITDFNPHLTKILNSEPDSIFVVGTGKGLGLAVKKIREAGFDKLIFTTLEFTYPDVLEIASNAAEGVVYSDFYIDYQNEPIAKNFNEAYLKKFNTPPGLDSVAAYNEILILANAFKKAENPNDVKQLIQILKNNLDVEVIGGYITGIPDREIKYELRLMTIKDGQPIPY